MSQDLIALDLGRSPRPGSAASAALLDALLALVRDLLAADEDVKRSILARRFEACRAALAGGAAADDLTELIDACLAEGREIVKELAAQQAERGREMSSVVSMVREVVGTVGSEMTTLHGSLQKSTDRFDAIGQMTDARQIKARLVAEVMTLKQLTVSRQKAWHETARGLGERIATLEGQLVATQTEASTDPLTGVANRRTFERTCAEWIRSSRSVFALALIDVDEFKQINDSHGHAAGDQVLVFIAQTLARSLRTGDVVARIGGDEFAVIGQGLTLDQAERRLKMILGKLKDPSADGSNPQAIQPSLSCGIAEFSAGDNMASLFKRADEALYAAKGQGKNRIVARPRPLIRDLIRR
jgi:diguanylate cyclase